MSITKYLLFLFMFSLGSTLIPTLVVAKNPTLELAYNAVYESVPPRENVKPREKKKKKISKKKLWKQAQEKTNQGLKKPALTFWLIFVIATILLIVAGAFIIGLGLAPWSVAAYVILGAELTAFAVLISILWGDRPGGTMYVNYVFALLGLVLVNIIIGVAFLIWGLTLAWPFGWMIGLIMLFLAGLFFLIHWLIAHVDTKK